MNNNLISKYPEFFTLLEKLHKENIYFTLDKLSNRLTMHNKNSVKKMEFEDIAAYFWKNYNVNLNPAMIITIIRGYYYQNLATEEDNNNIIKDDFYYSILEFTKDKSNIKLNDLCTHLFNLNSNKVKQEVRTHICRCLTEIGFYSKRTETGIKWIKSHKEPSCLQEKSETIVNKDLQTMYPGQKEPTLCLQEPTGIETNNELIELKLLLEEKEKLIKKLEKRDEESKIEIEKYRDLFILHNQGRVTAEKENNKLEEKLNKSNGENNKLKEELQQYKNKETKELVTTQFD